LAERFTSARFRITTPAAKTAHGNHQTESLDVVQSAANIQRVAVPLKGVP